MNRKIVVEMVDHTKKL